VQLLSLALVCAQYKILDNGRHNFFGENMKSDLVFRRATDADIPAMSVIRLAVKENSLTNPGRITPQMYEDYLDALGRGWVCESTGVIIAFSYAAKQDASIWALFTSPAHEGMGAGKVLLKLATDWLFSLGHQTVTLGTTVDTRADRFYARQGWTRGAMKDAVEVLYTLNKLA
jgi:GNAT superfamily N-acetyltransferase